MTTRQIADHAADHIVDVVCWICLAFMIFVVASWVVLGIWQLL